MPADCRNVVLCVYEGPLAQPVERSHGMREVSGSIPLRSTWLVQPPHVLAVGAVLYILVRGFLAFWYGGTWYFGRRRVLYFLGIVVGLRGLFVIDRAGFLHCVGFFGYIVLYTVDMLRVC